MKTQSLESHQAFLKDIEDFERTKKMSFLAIGDELQKYQDEHTVEAGEYLVRITGATIPDGANYMIVRFEITDDPYAKEVTKFFNLPGAGRDAKEENRNLGTLKKFYAAFGMDLQGNYNVSEQEPDGFVGREGYVMLGPAVDDGKGYGEQNRISKFSARA